MWKLKVSNPYNQSNMVVNRGWDCGFMNWPLSPEVKERPKEEAGHSRLVGGRFTSGGGYAQGLSEAATRHLDLSTCPPEPRNCLNMKALTGLGHVCHPHGLDDTLLSQGRILETALAMRTVGGTDIPRTGCQGEEPPIAWVWLSSQVAVTSSQRPPPVGRNQEMVVKEKKVAVQDE